MNLKYSFPYKLSIHYNSYRTKLKSPAKKQVRISAGGMRTFRLLLNGDKIFCGDGSAYVPAFHRDNSWTYAELESGENIIEIFFEDGRVGEFFLGFGTINGCGEWLNHIERYL